MKKLLLMLIFSTCMLFSYSQECEFQEMAPNEFILTDEQETEQIITEILLSPTFLNPLYGWLIDFTVWAVHNGICHFEWTGEYIVNLRGVHRVYKRVCPY